MTTEIDQEQQAPSESAAASTRKPRRLPRPGGSNWWRLPLGLPRRTWRAARANSRRVTIVLAGLAAVALVVTVVLGVLAYGQHQVESAKADATRAGQDDLTKLLSYDYRSVDQDVADRGAMLAGPFRDQYASLVRDVVGPAAKSGQVVTRSTVVSTSIIDATSDEVTLLAFVNQDSRSPKSPQPVQTGSRVRVGMEEANGQWLVTEITPV